jgi:hypothetical protein
MCFVLYFEHYSLGDIEEYLQYCLDTGSLAAGSRVLWKAYSFRLWNGSLDLGGTPRLFYQSSSLCVAEPDMKHQRCKPASKR